MKNVLLPIVLLCCGAPLFAEPPQGYVLKWSDEFDGAELDPAKWVYWLPGKRRHAMNVPEAVTLRDGFLTIATYTEAGKHFTGMISTRDQYEAQYGYYEARIEWADAPGQWSAFWSQTPTIGKPIDDVAAAGMEIDFVEHRAVDHEGKPIAGKANFARRWKPAAPCSGGCGWRAEGPAYFTCNTPRMMRWWPGKEQRYG